MPDAPDQRLCIAARSGELDGVVLTSAGGVELVSALAQVVAGHSVFPVGWLRQGQDAAATSPLDQLPGAIELGEGDGMQSFDKSLTDLLDGGLITREEALAHAPSPDTFKMRLQGVVRSESKRILGAR